MRESKVKRVIIRIGSIGLMLMLSLGMTACSCSRQEVGNTEETTINIITEKDSSGSNQGEDTAPKIQGYRNEGNLVADGTDIYTTVKEEWVEVIDEIKTGSNPNNVYFETFYSETMKEQVLVKNYKNAKSREVFDSKGKSVLAIAGEVTKSTEDVILEMEIGQKALDKVFGKSDGKGVVSKRGW